MSDITDTSAEAAEQPAVPAKPVHPDILRSKVDAYVDLSRKTRELADANAART